MSSAISAKWAASYDCQASFPSVSFLLSDTKVGVMLLSRATESDKPLVRTTSLLLASTNFPLAAGSAMVIGLNGTLLSRNAQDLPSLLSKQGSS